MSNKQEIISDWFQQYSQDVFDFLVYYMGIPDVDDLVQEVFIKVYKGLNSYKNQSSPKTWIFSIARNVAIDEIRKNKRKGWTDYKSFDERLGSQDKDIPELIFLQNEEQKELYQAIQQLKKSYRDVLILRGIKEFSIAETAQILRWKETKVKNSFHRAIQTLRKQYERR